MTSLHKSPTAPPDDYNKEAAKKEIKRQAERLGRWQQRLYAQKTRSVLVILQGLDGAGKDNTVKHVFKAVNPSGCRVKGFRAPSEEELAHDFLWRIHKEAPERGMIQIFNRSHYEDVLVPVVNGDLKRGKALEARYQAINAFEQALIDAGTLVFKFYLHISEEGQQARLAERRDDPEKYWKHDPADDKVFDNRDAYLRQYEHVFKHCQQAAPWHIIPADERPYKNLRILQIINKALGKAGLKFPDRDEL